jgi:xanthine/uracil permease
MKQAVFVGVMAGSLVAVVMGAVAMVRAANAQWERNERAFRAECEAVNGRAVWNNKYWECLK